jgi:lipopolysaccharide biosynthesis regulator YciM
MENFIGFIFFVGIIAFIILTVVYLSRRRMRLKLESDSRAATAYVEALNELIVDNYSRAMELLKESVRLDTNNIDAYVKLGIIFRIQGNPLQALKIHKELTIRSSLTKKDLIEIYRNIVSDHIDLKQYDEALQYCDKVLALDPKNHSILDIQPTIYAFKHDYKNAFKVLKANAEKGAQIDHQLALYKIAHGRALVERGEYHDARIIFKEALKLDHSEFEAHLYIGDAYAHENRREDAVKVWHEFAEEFPQKSYLVFDYLDEAYFESNNYSAMEVFYSTIIEKDPDNYRALQRLGEIYFKKGEREKALEMTERSLRVNPKSLEGIKNLILYLNNVSDIEVIKEKALKLVDMVEDLTTYRCRFCGYQTKDILVLCPSCEKWDAFEY